MKHAIITNLDSLEGLDFTPTVAICFYIRDDNVHKAYKKVIKIFPDITVFGCSTENSMLKDRHATLNFDSGCAWILLEIDNAASEVMLFEDKKPNIATLKKIIGSDRNYNIIMLASKLHFDISMLIGQLSDISNISDIFGGIASSHSSRSIDHKVSIFHNGKLLEYGVILWLLDTDSYALHGRSMHDFEPVGLELTITHADKHTIYEIENKPALEMLESVIGDIRQEDIDSFAYPLTIYKTDYKKKCISNGGIISSIRSKNREEGSITMFRQVCIGDKLKVSIPVTLDEQKVRIAQMVEELRFQENNILFWFICIGIERYYGDMERVFLLKLSKSLDRESIGLYTAGEIGRLAPECSTGLQNQTVTILSLASKD